MTVEHLALSWCIFCDEGPDALTEFCGDRPVLVRIALEEIGVSLSINRQALLPFPHA
jgi:hypothetical protein